jgi:hypothetical protein
MFRSFIAAAVLATGLVTGIAGPARAFQPYAQGYGTPAFQAPGYGVQAYGNQGYGFGQPDWRQRQEWRRERDEARIAEAARQEAWRIQQEHEQRREWRHAQWGGQWREGGYRNW